MQNCILFETGFAEALLTFSDVSSSGGVTACGPIIHASLFCIF
jgi:hypothetical protein